MEDMAGRSLTSGVFSEAWELVKRKPGETLLLSFLTLMFNGGGGSFSMPSPPSGGGGGSQSPETWEQSTNGAGGALTDVFQSIAGQIGAMEFALIAGIIGIALVVGVIMFVIGTVIRGGANIYWLRLVRGQAAELGHTFAVKRFFAPLLIATLLSAIAVMLGSILCIIPGIIAALGFFFVQQVVVDKNIGYMEALKYSWEITDGHKLDLLIFWILAALLNIAGILACCVGVVVTNAVVMGATTILYTRLTPAGNAYLEPGEAADTSAVW